MRTGSRRMASVAVTAPSGNRVSMDRIKFTYSIDMKFRMIACFVIATLLIAGLAMGQNKPDAEKAEKIEPLSLVKIAANVAINSQHQDLNGFLAIYMDSHNWASGLKDSDLGPFLKLKEEKPGRSAVLFFSPDKDVAISIFFDGDSAIGVTAAKAKNGKIESSDISAAYKPVSKEMLKGTAQELQFTQGDLTTDDGQPVTGFQITSASKKPAN